MQATVDRLEVELSELQQSRTALHQDNAQQLESLERLRRENSELQQRVSMTCCLAFTSVSVLLSSMLIIPVTRSEVRIVFFSFRIELNRIVELLFEISNRIE